MAGNLYVELGLLAFVLPLYAFVRWTHVHWRHKRVGKTGFVIWAACLAIGLLLGWATNHLVPKGTLRMITGYAALILGGGGLGVMGLYLGWRLSLLRYWYYGDPPED